MQMIAVLLIFFCAQGFGQQAHGNKKAPLKKATLGSVRSELLAMNLEAAKVDKILNDGRLKRPFKRFKNSGTLTWDELEIKLCSTEWLRKGQEFQQAHFAALEKAKNEFDISEPVVVGVITIETMLGEFTGDWPALEAHHQRFLAGKPGSKQDLVQMIKYCLTSSLIDCFLIPGSSTGAIGYSQFMPGNLPRFGVDGDGDGVVNLFNYDDAIASTAKFLSFYMHRSECLKRAKGNPVQHALVHYFGATSPYQRIVVHYTKDLSELLKVRIAQK